jgi:hypothetical protein
MSEAEVLFRELEPGVRDELEREQARAGRDQRT